MDVLGFAGGAELVLSEPARVALAASGLNLTRDQLARVATARRDALAELDRVEFAAGVIDELVVAFADSPFLGGVAVGDALVDVVALFYAVRDDVPVDVPDDEVLVALRAAFDGVEGEVEALDAPELARALAARDGQMAGAAAAGDAVASDVAITAACNEYAITDDEGRVYRWSADWGYDEFALGWDGERWDDDLD